MLEKIVDKLKEAKVKDLTNSELERAIPDTLTRILAQDLIKFGYLTIDNVYCECDKCQKGYSPCR